MTKEELYELVRERFRALVRENDLEGTDISVHVSGLSSEEAIGTPKRKDYPLLTGKEVLLQAEYKGCYGQAFTSAPSEYAGELASLLEADIVNEENSRALFIASLNAVMRYLGLVKRSIHCKNEEPECCAEEAARYIEERYVRPRILLVGYQPALFEKLASRFPLRVLDLNPQNIGKCLYGVTVENGRDYKTASQWADLILCTGSTLSNGTIAEYLNLEKELIFYGTTLSGAAELLGLKRICFCSA